METLRTKLLTGTTTTPDEPKDVEASATAATKNDDLELPVIVDFSRVAEMDFTAAKVKESQFTIWTSNLFFVL